MKNIYKGLIGLLFYVLLAQAIAQPTRTEHMLELNYATPQSYIIDQIEVVGAKFLDSASIIAITGLQVGNLIQIPGQAMSDAIKRLWKQKLIDNAAVYVAKIVKDRVTLTIEITERPKLDSYFFEGIKKKQAKKLTEKISLKKGKIITDALIKQTAQSIKNYFIEKRFLYTTVAITPVPDSTLDHKVRLKIQVNKHKKFKINRIFIDSTHYINSAKLRRKMKNTQERVRFTLPLDFIKKVFSFYPFRKKERLKRLFSGKAISDYVHKHAKLTFFSRSKFIKAKYEADKKNIIDWYATKGFIDARIVKDTIYKHNDRSIDIRLQIDEGTRYFVRNITWTGNYQHNDKKLNQIFSIKKGDVYNPALIQQKLHFNPKGSDISSLYMDNGYFSFQITPIIMGIVSDSVDLEMRIHEGAQHVINNVIIQGNERTYDYVIRRELRTLPGDKFDRSKVLRSQRELAQLNFFDPNINILPIPNPADTTVDLQYNVKERPSDQVELSAGWGGGIGFVGSLGLVLNNFSLRNLTHFKNWHPLPVGDAQQLSLRFQANDKSYQNYSLSFVEPWLGGKRFNTLSLSLSHSILKSKGSFKSTGASVSLGRRLTWPDDYFILSIGTSYYYYDYENYNLLRSNKNLHDGKFMGFGPLFFGEKKRLTGVTNNLSIHISIDRNSTDSPFYPSEGTMMGLHTKFTPPYGLFFQKNPKNLSQAEKLKWITYQQYLFDAAYFANPIGKLVINPRMHVGLLGNLFSNLPMSPFERFYLGGSGLSGQGFILGGHIIPLRGYLDDSIVPKDKKTGYSGGVLYNKFTLEVRHPITLNPFAPIYALAFAEGGNNWIDYAVYNFFDMKKSVGLGIRIFMPIFGMLGLDWGYGFDKDIVNNQEGASQWHISLGKQIR